MKLLLHFKNNGSWEVFLEPLTHRNRATMKQVIVALGQSRPLMQKSCLMEMLLCP